MEPSKPHSEGRRLKRKQVLEKKRAVNEAINAAFLVKDHLAYFTESICQCARDDMFVYLESGFGEKLSSSMKRYIQDLLKVNMEGHYGSEWPKEVKIKRREMVSPEARYIFVRKKTIAKNEAPLDVRKEMTFTRCMGQGDPVVGFVQYRFLVEEENPVLYIYELQLEPSMQGKGIGKFLMQLIELIAQKNHMTAVMLTVQKTNRLALNFYLNTLRYTISNISPSRADPLLALDYEILCKTFEHEAKVKLEMLQPD